MKYSKRPYLLLCVICLFVFIHTSCDRDEFENEEVIETEIINEEEEQRMSGVVTTFSNVPIGMTEVSIILDGNVIDQVESDMDGKFRFGDIEDAEVGKFILQAKKDGFVEYTQLTQLSNDLHIKLPEESCELSGPLSDAYFDSENYKNAELVSIKGRVFAEDGSPAANTRVWVNSSGIYGDENIEKKTFVVITVVNPDGTWETIAPIGTSIEITLNPQSSCTGLEVIEYGLVGEEDIEIADINNAELLTASRIKVKPLICQGAEQVEWEEYFLGERQASVSGDIFWYRGGYSFANDVEIERDGALDYCHAICGEKLTYYTLLLKDQRTRRFHYEHIKLDQNFNIDFGEVEICTEFLGEANLSVNGIPIPFYISRLELSPINNQFHMNTWFAPEGIKPEVYHQFLFSGQDFGFNKSISYTKDDKYSSTLSGLDNDNYGLEIGNDTYYVGDLHIGELDKDGYVTCHIDGELISVDWNSEVILEYNGKNKIKGWFKIPVFYAS